jgi:uncharacterized membrane protein YfcA
MEILGFLSAIIIGISLGLIGGGGSILTIPVLVYLFKIEPTTATAYSLFIVGFSSIVAVIPKYRHGLVHLKTAIIFGAPAIVTVFLTRKYIIPVIPTEIFTIYGYTVSKSMLTMLVFSALMISASISLIKNNVKESIIKKNASKEMNYPLMIIEGALIGSLTSFVGAGGGFLIIPALVFLAKLPMKTAIGTSLLIVAVSSSVGFIGDLTLYLNNHPDYSSEINWNLLIIFTSLSIAGTFLGNFLSNKIDGNKLKKGLGWSVLIMGIYIMLNELLK